MSIRMLMGGLLAWTLSAAAPGFKTEAPLVAQASALYRAKSCAMPKAPADLLKWHQEGDVDLVLGALTGRWMVDRLAEGKLPDAQSESRMLEGFAWDEAGVLALHTAGIETNVLRMLARAKPLGLTQEAQARLLQTGVEARVVALLGRIPAGSLPPMKSVADPVMQSLAGDPMFGNPSFKAQLEDQRGKIEKGLGKEFQTEAFRNRIWEQILLGWRSRIQVGADTRNWLSQAPMDLADAPTESPNMAMPGMWSAAQMGNDLFLRSTPLGLALAARDVVAVLRSRTTAVLRASEPKDFFAFRVEDATVFRMRQKPTDLALVRLQDLDGKPSVRLTQGVYLGREFRPVEDPVPMDMALEEGLWVVRPKARLAPGSYAFLLGAEHLQFLPFMVR